MQVIDECGIPPNSAQTRRILDEMDFTTAGFALADHQSHKVNALANALRWRVKFAGGTLDFGIHLVKDLEVVQSIS